MRKISSCTFMPKKIIMAIKWEIKLSKYQLKRKEERSPF